MPSPILKLPSVSSQKPVPAVGEVAEAALRNPVGWNWRVPFVTDPPVVVLFNSKEVVEFILATYESAGIPVPETFIPLTILEFASCVIVGSLL